MKEATKRGRVRVVSLKDKGVFSGACETESEPSRMNDDCDKPIFRSSDWLDDWFWLTLPYTLIKSESRCEHNYIDFKGKHGIIFCKDNVLMLLTAKLCHEEFPLNHRPKHMWWQIKSATEGGRVFPFETECIALGRLWIDGFWSVVFIHRTSDKLPFTAAFFMFLKRAVPQIYLLQW